MRYLILLMCTCWILALYTSCQKDVQNDEHAANANEESTFYVPVSPITQSPGHHWFGYYDKWQFDPTGRFVLSNEVDFENRSPNGDDTIKVGMIDLDNDNQWIELGESNAWNWQQGCMLQFIPESDSLIIWNDRENDQFISHILNIYTREKRTLPVPIYTLSPDGKTAMTLNFARLNDSRPGYGYAGIIDKYQEELAPDSSGLVRVNLETGDQELIISLADIVALGAPESEDSSLIYDFYTYKTWFNHLLFNTDGSRFIFLFRWKSPSIGSFGTLMFTATPDGEDIRLVDPSGYTSHFIWRDPDHILAWSRTEAMGDAFYIFEDVEGGIPEIVGESIMTRNGHCTYLPGNEWILNDTYPDKDRLQHVYLYHIASNSRIPLGDFYLDPKYKGEWRVDTHPRFNHQGTQVVIDCPNGEQGRQLFQLDISEIVQKPPQS